MKFSNPAGHILQTAGHCSPWVHLAKMYFIQSASAPPSWIIQELLTPSPVKVLEVQIFLAVGAVPFVTVLLLFCGDFWGK